MELETEIYALSRKLFHGKNGSSDLTKICVLQLEFFNKSLTVVVGSQ